MSDRTDAIKDAIQRTAPTQPVTALDLIAAERRRQVVELGYGTQQDDEYSGGELSLAASAYAVAERMRFVYGYKANQLSTVCLWPWDLGSFKPATDNTPESRIRELTKAGALIIAEIERLQRLQRLQAKAGAQ